MLKGQERHGQKKKLEGMKGNVFRPEQGLSQANACLFCKSVCLGRASPYASAQEESGEPNAYYMIMELQDGNYSRSQHAFRKESWPGGFSSAQGLSMDFKCWSLRVMASNLVRDFVHSCVCTGTGINVINDKRTLPGIVVWSITFWVNKKRVHQSTCSDQVTEHFGISYVKNIKKSLWRSVIYKWLITHRKYTKALINDEWATENLFKHQQNGCTIPNTELCCTIL